MSPGDIITLTIYDNGSFLLGGGAKKPVHRDHIAEYLHRVADILSDPDYNLESAFGTGAVATRNGLLARIDLSRTLSKREGRVP